MTAYDRYIDAIAAALSTPHTPAQLRARLRVAGVLPSRIRSPAMHVAGGKRPREEEGEQIVGDVLRTPGFRDLTPELVGEIMALLPRLGRVRLALASRRTLAAYRGMPHANERKIPARDMLVEPPVPAQIPFFHRVVRMDITPDDTLLMFPKHPQFGVDEVALDGTLVRVHQHPRPPNNPDYCAYGYDADSDRMAVAVSSVWMKSVTMQVYERRTQKLVRSFRFDAVQ